MAISRDGNVVVGYAGFGFSSASEAFRWTASDGMVGLGGLAGWNADGSPRSQANDVSADGTVIVGNSVSTLSHDGEAFRWTQASGMQSIITHGSSASSFRTSAATAVSDDGTIVYGSGQTFNNTLLSFRSENGGYHQVGRPLPSGVSSDGVITAGNRFAIPGPGTSTAFRDDWSGTASIALGDFVGGAAEASALDISADGSTIVGWGTTVIGREPFVWTEATGMQSLGPLPAAFSFGARANAISADGRVIVGEGFSGMGGAFIWTQEGGLRLLADILTDELGLDLLGWQAVLAANDVSSDGRTIVGYGVNPAGRFEAFVAHIPLPNTATLLLTGTLIVLIAQCGWPSPATSATKPTPS